MKNKKLFAILTLVCFMMTLMPVAAFAADTVSVSDNKVSVGDTFTASSSTDSAYYYLVDEDGVGVAIANASNEFTIKTPGKYEVYAVKSTKTAGDPVHEIMTEATMFIKDKIALIEANHSDLILDDYAEVKVSAATITNVITLSQVVAGTGTFTAGTPATLTGLASDNGFTSPVLSANLTANTKDVKGAELTYATNSGYLKVQKIDSVTDKHGNAKFKLAATKAGDYKVTVKYGKASAVINVTVNETTVAGVSVVAEPTRPVALGSAVNAFTGIVFKLTDANGVVITGTNGTAFGDSTLLKVAVIDQPADADLDTATLDLEWNAVKKGWVIAAGTETFDEEGKYTFKVTLANGVSATASVKIAEFDEPVAMELTYPTNTINFGAANAVSIDDLVLIDKNGTELSYTDPMAPVYTYKFVAEGKALYTIDAVGTVAAIPTPAETAVKNALLGTKINVMVICEELGLTANAELLVANDASALKYASTAADVAVNNTLVVNTVDASGNVIKMAALDLFDGSTNADEVYVYVLDAPENAVYDIDARIDTANKRVLVDFTASAVGEYKVQLALVVKDSSTGATLRYLSSVETITVGGVVDNGTKSVIVLSIGSKNMINNGEVGSLLAAPEIKDGRTMIPMRAGLEAFGATVEWNKDDRSITAEMNGVTVVMKLDSLTYTVNGKVMKADAAPYIKNGSTMVPAVFFTKAFGITATPLYDDNGVCDVLFSK